MEKWGLQRETGNRSRRVCVFCGSSLGGRSAYRSAAMELGRRLGDAKIGLVYGGAQVGLMGVLADEALKAGGEVIGVIPRALAGREVAHRHLTRLDVVESMHERKAIMVRESDAFVALPGGFGTLDEFFEVLTWAQLEIHDKPCLLLNIDGYFDDLLAFLDKAATGGFLKQENRSLIHLACHPEEVLPALEALWKAPRAMRAAEGAPEP